MRPAKKFSRRRFLGLAAALPGAAALSCKDEEPGADDWDRGPLAHLLPTASHVAFNIKASFREPQAQVPLLRVGRLRVRGDQKDTAGRFWSFRISGLTPDTEYELQLEREGESVEPICDPWPLRTLPARNSKPDHLRIGAFTCAGGMSVPISPAIFEPFRSIAYRRRLFDLLLEHQPDLVVANGDHVYFDLPMAESIRAHPLAKIAGPFIRNATAKFDPDLPVLGSSNEVSLTTVGDDQIASIYGVRFRSTPVFFITDDHDYFDNDDATPERVTFPPDDFHHSLRNHLQSLYFPEFLSPDETERALPGQRLEAGVALSTHFGSVRYGDLFAGFFYDCGGYLSLGEGAGLVPPSVERWLLEETRREDTLHAVHFPSHPMGWTAGKWREWYRDRLESSGSLLAAVGVDEQGGKFEWQPGWWAQHQRLLGALSAQTKRKAVVVSGDLHALGAAIIESSGALALGQNPVHTLLSGPVGVGELGWPSRARGVTARVPAELSVRSLLDLDERNGFSVLDFDRAGAKMRTYGCPAGYVSPDRLSVTEAVSIDLPIA